MTPTTEVFRVGLAALITGLAVPLLVQLFLLLRDVRRTTLALDQRLERTLTDLGDVVAELKHATVPAPPLAAQLAAAVPAALPAIIAAVRAFRSEMTHENGTSPRHTKET